MTSVGSHHTARAKARSNTGNDRRGGAGTAGTGYAPAHHGELLQGVFADDTGRIRRALVTVPLASHGSRVVFRPSDRESDLTGPPELIKACRGAELALREVARYRHTRAGGRIEVTSNVPRGVGMGSSTSDVTAAIRAVADCYDVILPTESVARLAVQAESASDSIMIDDRVTLFAHRDGLVLETLGHRLPPMLVIGCNTSPGGAVDTVASPLADFTRDDVTAFRVLRAGLRRALASGDVPLLGRVATASARINQRLLPKPALEPLIALCRRLGGYGVQVAHSGTVAGLIFNPQQSGIERTIDECLAAMDALGLPPTTVITPDQIPGRFLGHQ